MGNELTADQQNGQVFNSLLTNLTTNQSPFSLSQPQDSVQNPSRNPIATSDPLPSSIPSPSGLPPAFQSSQVASNAPAPNQNNYSAFRGSKFVRGDEIKPIYQSRFGQDIQTGPKNNQSTANLINGMVVSRVNSGYQANGFISQNIHDPNKSPIKNESKSPFSFFQNIFGGATDNSDSKLRSSSVRNGSMSMADRKIALLQSNIQVSQKKIQSLTKTIEQIQKTLNTSETALKQSQTSLIQSQQTSQYLHQKCLNLESQIKSYQNQLQSLSSQQQSLQQLLSQKDGQLYQKDRYISELELQTRTQKNQIQLQQSRLNQCAIREERKDKELREVSLAKFELNAIKIRLENGLKIVEEQVIEKDKCIEELNQAVLGKNKDIQVVKGEKQELVHSIQQLNQRIQTKMLESEHQITSLQSELHNIHLHLQQKETRISQQGKKVSQLLLNQSQNQETISNLQNSIMDNKQEIRRLEKQVQKIEKQKVSLKQDIKNMEQESKKAEQDISKIQEQYRSICEGYKEEIGRHRQIGENILSDFNNAKKIGQKQIEFLELKLEELTKQRQLLSEQLQLTKVTTVQRNQIFERTIIYDLKKQNDRLWAKLIEKSNDEMEISREGGNGDIWKNRDILVKQNREQEKPDIGKQASQTEQKGKLEKDMGKGVLEIRYEDFVRKLEGTSQNNRQSGNNITRDISNQSLSKLQQNIEFYRQKCNQLQKMVQTHIQLNKSLKSQIEKYTNYQLAFQTYRQQVQTLKQQNKALSSELQAYRNPLAQQQNQQKQKRLENKIKDLEFQNKRYFEEIDKMGKEMENTRGEARKMKEEVYRLNGEAHVYKKWQSLYEELKVRYDAILMSSREDYKGMYDDLIKEMDRLKSLYQLKEGDYEKLKKISLQKQQNLQKQLKIAQSSSSSNHENFLSVSSRYSEKQQQLQSLQRQVQSMEQELLYFKQLQQKSANSLSAGSTAATVNTGSTISKQTLQKMAVLLKAKIAELEESLRKIRQFAKQGKMTELQVELGRGESLLAGCLGDCNKIVQN